MISHKNHLTLEGLQEIVNIKAVLNKGLSDKLKLFPDTQIAIRPLFPLSKTVDTQWIAGFTTGEGCFFIDVLKSTTTVTGFQVRPRFILTQHVRDEKLMRSLV